MTRVRNPRQESLFIHLNILSYCSSVYNQFFTYLTLIESFFPKFINCALHKNFLVFIHSLCFLLVSQSKNEGYFLFLKLGIINCEKLMVQIFCFHAYCCMQKLFIASTCSKLGGEAIDTRKCGPH